jgi:hypothetical protein
MDKLEEIRKRDRERVQALIAESPTEEINLVDVDLSSKDAKARTALHTYVALSEVNNVRAVLEKAVKDLPPAQLSGFINAVDSGMNGNLPLT